MKLKGLLALALLITSKLLLGQTTVTSGTVVDSDSTAWAGGTVTVEFVPSPTFPNPASYTVNGAPLSSSVTKQTATLDGSGHFSLTVYDNTRVSPIGSQWRYTVCPNASTKCGALVTSIAGSTQNLSTAITAVIPAPRFQPVSGAFGYNDGEATIQLLPGSTYYNTTNLVQRLYSGATWSNSTGTIITLPVPIANGGTGATTASAGLAALGGLAGNGVTTSNTSGGSIDVPGVVNSGMLEIKEGPYLDVKAWGAACNWNGSSGTDDTTDIQAAINAAALANNLPVYVTGQCAVSTLTIPAGVNLYGLNKNLAPPTGSNSVPSMLVHNTDSAPLIYINGAATPGSGYGIRDIALRGFGASAGTQDSAIVIHGTVGGQAHNVDIDNVSISNFGEYGILCDYSQNNPLYINHINMEGVFLNRTQASIVGGIDNACNDLQLTDSRDITVSSNSTLYNNPPTLYAIALRGHSQVIDDIVAEESEGGLYVSPTADLVQVTNSRWDLNCGHGLFVDANTSPSPGLNVWTNNVGLNNSQCANNTYDDFHVVGTNNSFDNNIALDNQAPVQALYGFNDVSTPNFSTAPFQTNYWGPGNKWASQNSSTPSIQWSPTTYHGTADFITDALNSVGLGYRGGSIPHQFNVYEKFADITDYARLALITSSGAMKIVSQYLGSGTPATLNLCVNTLGCPLSIATNGNFTLTDLPSGNTITGGGNGWTFTGGISTTATNFINVTAGPAYQYINDVSGGNSAQVVFQNSGVTKWVVGKANLAFTIFDSATGATLLSGDGAGNSTLGESGGVLSLNGTVELHAGTNVVYRCLTAGSVLPAGSLTVTSADCGTYATTSLSLN